MAQQKIVMRGAMGLHLSCLNEDHLAHLQKRLTLKTRPFKEDDPPQIVQSFKIAGGRFWVPRFFDWMDFWPKIEPAGWQWVAPYLDYDLKSLFTPDPARHQPEAIEKTVAHLKKHSSGIDVLPTAIGKTFLALEIARHFQTPIAVLIPKGDMVDNWVEHCTNHLGIPPHDVGIVKEGRRDDGKPVTICSIQTLLSRDIPQSFYEQFGFVIADEVHHYGAEQWSKVVSYFPARYRLGISANPIRDDGLDPVVRWNFGKVAFAIYKRTSGQLPLVCLVRYPGEYSERQYRDWKKNKRTGKWEMGRPNSMKYAKLLMADEKRNSWLVGRIIDARLKSRKILIFAKHRAHIEILYTGFRERWAAMLAKVGTDTAEKLKNTRVSLLWGGLKDKDRRIASVADVIFTTYGFSKEATNLPHLDTVVLATPAGDPLQTVGRLRDKGDKGRQAFLVFDPYEGNPYSFKKATERTRAYRALGIEVKRVAKKTI